MEISILAVSCRTFRFNRPQPRAQTVLLARHAIILPNEGQERVTNPWKAQGRPVPLHDATGIWKRLCVPSAGKRGKLQTLPKVARRPTSILLTSYLRIATHQPSLKKQSTNAFSNTFFRPTSRLIKQFATQKQHEFKRTLTYPCQNSR